jgi:hypothetical protein
VERWDRDDYEHGYYGPPLVLDVWTSKGEGAVYRPGERMRVYFRASADCYVTLYNIDTQGYVHLLYPARRMDQHFIEGGVTYRIPARRDPYDLVISGPSGIEYIEGVASIAPFREEFPWYLDPEYSEWEDTDTPWTLFGDDYGEYGDDYDYYADIGVVRGDPFLGIQRIDRRLIPEDYPSTMYATAYTSFYVSTRVAYPRYLCYDCHWHEPRFDSYAHACIVFDIRLDRTWVYSPRIYVPDYRPRYYYSVKTTAPLPYRNTRHFWSSRDGLQTLRKEFRIARPPGVETQAPPPRAKSGRQMWTPKAGPGGETKWMREPAPSGMKTWKSGKAPVPSQKLEELKQKLETKGLLNPKSYEAPPQKTRDMNQNREREIRENVRPPQGEKTPQAQKPRSTQQQEKGKQKSTKDEEESNKTKSKSKSR